MKRVALVAGASGLVGGEIVRQLCEDDAYGQVIAVVRRPLEPRDKLVCRVVDWGALGEVTFEDVAEADAFSALGTTIKKAGSQAAFRRVDHEFTLAFARAALRCCKAFALVSSYGADAGSRVFYNRVKGETEAAVGALGFASTVIARPSILEGERAESRPGEAIGSVLAGAIGALPFRAAKRIRPVHARDVAGAMIHAVKQAAPGVRVMESEELPGVAGG